MRKRDRAEVERYVRFVADEMGLRDWTITVYFEAPESPDRQDSKQWGAAAEVTPGRKHAAVTLGPALWETDPDEQRETIVHELVHLHFGAMFEQVREDITDSMNQQAYDLFQASFRRNMEYGVDAVAEVIAKHLPLIEWPK